MELLKKHYEKILLGVVLLGLVFGLVFLPLYVIHDRNVLTEYSTSVISRQPKPLAPLELTAESNVIRRLEQPYRLDFERANKLFNPVEWERAANGQLIKASQLGPDRTIITKITPLYFTMTLKSVETNVTPVRYEVVVERQAARRSWQRAPQQKFASAGETNDVFTLRSVQGPPDNPTNLVLQLKGSGETVNVSRTRPYRRVDGYMADLKYPPEGRTWTNQRVGAVLRFAGDVYKIVAIGPDEVVLSAQSNEKKTTLQYSSK